MANAIEKLNTIAIANIEKVNTITDANLEDWNTLEFTGVTDAHTLISTHTASSSSSLDITSGIDSTYDVYEWVFTNMHPQTNQADFSFQVNASGESGFNETITSTFFRAYQNEADSAHLGYNTNADQGNGTAYQPLTFETGNDNDQSCSGVLTLYGPPSTTYVKHFIARTSDYQADDHAMDIHIAGFINTTAAIDEISFKFDTGNIDAGVIKMYGLAKS